MPGASRLIDSRTQGEKLRGTSFSETSLAVIAQPDSFRVTCPFLRDTYEFVIHEQTALHGHLHQRVLEPSATVTAYAIGLAIQRENTAQVLVMTTKQEVKRRYDVFHTDLLRCATFSCLAYAPHHLLVAHLGNASGLPLQAFPSSSLC